MKYVIKLILCMLAITAFGQDPSVTGDTYFFLGIGLPITKVKDEGHSSLTYRGWSPTIRIGHERISREAVSRISVAASYGLLSPKPKPKAKTMMSGADLTFFQINYTYYSRLGTYSTEGWNRHLGGSVTLTIDVRNYNLPSNNVFGYMANLSLNVGGLAQKKLSESWRVHNELFTPLLTYSLRPNFIGMVPMTSDEFSPKKTWKTGHWVLPHKAFRLYNRLSFDQRIKDYRSRRLFYSWDFHSNTVSKLLRSVQSGFGYESLFKM